ncbi:YkvA family protein [Pantoea sp. NSTU24]|uniref:YkvA family protein n=1 Tax=Pantoea sp. NSTU24 TaxID=3391144 RepID=UPI003D04B3BC
MLVAAYAVSPGDLIPDFIPVIGLPDDLIPVSSRIMMVVHLVPKEVMHGHRETVAQATRHPISRIIAGILILLWGLRTTLLVRARMSCRTGLQTQPQPDVPRGNALQSDQRDLLLKSQRLIERFRQAALFHFRLHAV